MKKIKKSTIFYLLGILLAMVVLSLTIGRQLVAGIQPGLGSFATVHFAGYLFFLIMPVEVLIPFYIAQGHHWITLLVLSLATALIAQTIDFGIGSLMSPKIKDGLISAKTYKRTEKYLEKYGYWTIFFFNLFPLSSPIAIFIAGILKFNLKRVLIYSFWGLLIKYLFMLFVFTRIF